eukprot:1994573-Pyramimonas_sp.AAC.1
MKSSPSSPTLKPAASSAVCSLPTKNRSSSVLFSTGHPGSATWAFACERQSQQGGGHILKVSGASANARPGEGEFTGESTRPTRMAQRAGASSQAEGLTRNIVEGFTFGP